MMLDADVGPDVGCICTAGHMIAITGHERTQGQQQGTQRQATG